MPLFLSGSNGVSGADGTAALPAVQGTDGNTGVFFPAADQVAIATGGVQRLLVDASGNMTVSGALSISGVTGNVYPLVLGTAQASTSGTSIDFTGIPSWVRRVTIMFNGVSTNGASVGLIQLGSASIQATGYAGAGTTGPAFSVFNYTTGFGMPVIAAAAGIVEGAVVITSFSSNTWVAQGSLCRSDAAVSGTTTGRVTLSGVLDRLRITTVGGTDTFDAGSINILFE